MTKTYYNEIDPYAAQWLRNLISAGHIAPGDVDERDIRDIEPSDLDGYTQCHFFAGIGVWSRALRLSGWPDAQPVWTGSCPCQPFSAAGRRAGIADERHLWPHFHWLIEQRRPPVVFGEQVASKDGLAWLDLVQSDLERAGYAVGAADLCAAGVGAPHIRQRLYWVAERLEDAQGKRSQGFGQHRHDDPVASRLVSARGSEPSVVADSSRERWDGRESPAGQAGRVGPEISCRSGGLADTHDQGLERREPSGERARELPAGAGGLADTGRPGPVNGFWRDADWLFCRDGKWRAVEPGLEPLAHGVAARVGKLRAFGNAIVPQAAQAFIEAYLDCLK